MIWVKFLVEDVPKSVSSLSYFNSASAKLKANVREMWQNVCYIKYVMMQFLYLFSKGITASRLEDFPLLV